MFCLDLKAKVCDGLEEYFLDPQKSSNLSDKLTNKLFRLVKEKNISLVISDTDKNVGLVIADVELQKAECLRQLNNSDGSDTFVKLTEEETNDIIWDIQNKLTDIEQKLASILTRQERKFLHSCDEDFAIPQFYILWKMHKNPVVGRPIVAGYKWLTTCASKMVNFYLKGYVSKFSTILPNSLTLEFGNQ